MENCEPESSAWAERDAFMGPDELASATLSAANVVQYIALPEVFIKTEHDKEEVTPQKQRVEVDATKVGLHIKKEKKLRVRIKDEPYEVSIKQELDFGPTLLQPQTAPLCSPPSPEEIIPDLSPNINSEYRSSPSFCTILLSPVPPPKTEDDCCEGNSGVPPEADSLLIVRNPENTYQTLFREQSCDGSNVEVKSVDIQEGVDCKYCVRLLAESKRTDTRTVRCEHCKHRATRKPNSTNVITLRTAKKSNLQSQESLVRKPTSPCIDKKLFNCEHCGYSANQFGNFKIHLRIHTGEKPFKCDNCEYKATSKATLNRHVRSIHTGEKPYKCPMCEYRASSSWNLKSHMITHTGEKPFKCEHCEYSASGKTRLMRHIRAHMGEKPFKCQICDYRASERSNLKAHMRLHTGEKPYNCELCEYRASRYSYIKRHMLTRHESATVSTSVAQ